jgi:hypothetical protein
MSGQLSNGIQETSKHFIICLNRLEIGLAPRLRQYRIGDFFGEIDIITD